MPALHALERQLAEHRTLLVAFSGGLDSTVLLHQLVQLRQKSPALQLRAIHVHHGLNPRADAWAAHCKTLCAEWLVDCVVARVQVDGQKKGIEAAAREARYRAFQQQLLPGETLLTAQHLDDQCETLLLALKRGSGPAGLAAMPLVGEFAGHSHLRPLLTQTREELERWAEAHGLSWIEDDSNQDTRFDRNFLRQAVLPLLHARWPRFSQVVARSAALCGEQEHLLDELLAESLAALTDDTGALAWPPLVAMSEARRAALLRRWIASQHGLMPSRNQLQRIWQEVVCSREDAEPLLVLGEQAIRRFRDRLYCLNSLASLRNQVIAWPRECESVSLPDALGTLQRGAAGVRVRAPAADEAVTVRFQAQGKFHILGRAGSRAIKKLWQEMGVPPWQRDRTPMLFYNDTLIAAPGVFITREGAPDQDAGWHIGWHQPEQKI